MTAPVDREKALETAGRKVYALLDDANQGPRRMGRTDGDWRIDWTPAAAEAFAELAAALALPALASEPSGERGVHPLFYRMEKLSDKLCQTQGYILNALSESGLAVVAASPAPLSVEQEETNDGPPPGACWVCHAPDCICPEPARESPREPERLRSVSAAEEVIPHTFEARPGETRCNYYEGGDPTEWSSYCNRANVHHEAPESPREVALPLGHEYVGSGDRCLYATDYADDCGEPEAAHAPAPKQEGR